MSKAKTNNKKNKQILLKIVFFFIIGYVVYIFAQQQSDINKYAMETKYYENLIIEANEENALLTKEKENINSDEYIEKIAREKLGYIMPNETIYIDANRY